MSSSMAGATELCPDGYGWIAQSFALYGTACTWWHHGTFLRFNCRWEHLPRSSGETIILTRFHNACMHCQCLWALRFPGRQLKAFCNRRFAKCPCGQEGLLARMHSDGTPSKLQVHLHQPLISALLEGIIFHCTLARRLQCAGAHGITWMSWLSVLRALP
eukprot:804815-Pelagomonas_calceolata.AAC.19